MNRRGFLVKAAVAGLAVASIPVSAALRFWPASPSADADGVQLEKHRLTEQEVVELTLNYAESYQDVLPGVNIRDALRTHLLFKEHGATTTR